MASSSARLVPFRVNLMTLHPATPPGQTPEVLFAGDIIHVDPACIDAALLQQGVFSREADGTPENRVPRPERSRLRGINVAEDEWDRLVELLETVRERSGRPPGTTRTTS